MARVKRGFASHAKHNKMRVATKGFRMTRNRLARKMKEAILHAGQYAYAGRKDRKSNQRRDWIMHINEALKEMGQTYSTFIKQMKDQKVELNRKVMAEILAKDPETFKKIVGHVKK